MAPASFLLWSYGLCAWAGLWAAPAIPHHQPLSLLPASTAPVSPWQEAAAAPPVPSLGWKTKGNGVGAPHHCPDLQHAQQALGTPDFEGCWRCRGAQGCRNFPDPSTWCPMPPVYHLLHIPSKKAAFLAEGGKEEKDYCVLAFSWYGKAVPTDGAVQSRVLSLWQSSGEAAAEHGIQIIKHNERWIISKQETSFIYYAQVKNKSVNKTIAQNGGIPGFLHPFMWGCSVPGERKGSSQPCSTGWSLKVLSWTYTITHQSFTSKGYIMQDFFLPQPNPRLQSLDTRAWHRACTHHLLGDGSKFSAEPSCLTRGHKHSMKTPGNMKQPGKQGCRSSRLSGGQKKERVNSRWPFLDLYAQTVILRAALFHQEINLPCLAKSINLKVHCQVSAFFPPDKMD